MRNVMALLFMMVLMIEAGDAFADVVIAAGHGFFGGGDSCEGFLTAAAGATQEIAEFGLDKQDGTYCAMSGRTTIVKVCRGRGYFAYVRAPLKEYSGDLLRSWASGASCGKLTREEAIQEALAMCAANGPCNEKYMDRILSAYDDNSVVKKTSETNPSWVSTTEPKLRIDCGVDVYPPSKGIFYGPKGIKPKSLLAPECTN